MELFVCMSAVWLKASLHLWTAADYNNRLLLYILQSGVGVDRHVPLTCTRKHNGTLLLTEEEQLCLQRWLGNVEKSKREIIVCNCLKLKCGDFIYKSTSVTLNPNRFTQCSLDLSTPNKGLSMSQYPMIFKFGICGDIPVLKYRQHIISHQPKIIDLPQLKRRSVVDKVSSCHQYRGSYDLGGIKEKVMMLQM